MSTADNDQATAATPVGADGVAHADDVPAGSPDAAEIGETSTTGYHLYYETTDTAVDASSPTALTPRHQRILLRLAVPLASLVQARKRGTVYISPLDVVIERSPLRMRRPDLFYISETRMKPDEEPAGAIEVGPDLVIEVLSPSETRRSFAPTLSDYTTIGVTEVWLVSPQSETIEVLRSTEDSFETAHLYGPGGVVQSEVLPGYTVDVDDIFA
jgi:Uma2 family endonuclease